MSYEADLEAAAREELERACTLGWTQLSALTPWGDTYEGFTPEGRAVTFERGYLWAREPGGDIHVEISVYEPHDYEEGVTVGHTLAKETAAGTGA
ncbi:hypothetical protein [Phenylobacterium sp.]|uniref:hypothetical protein n=1 Tax=Phenylobacterium sp. TaxID=1871053 RepID=UPI001206ABE9|nr:hypothetical protein [Phenylobacterium sp.]THD64292.1 MAG: hypothetical protein E8A49_02035 [Phenylobacterium sp.]